MKKEFSIKALKAFNLNKTILTIIFLSTVQISAAAGVFVYDYLNNKLYAQSNAYGLILLLIIIISVLAGSVFTLRDVSSKSRRSKQYEMIKDSLAQVEKLNNTLRGQRHDFMNHLQVVYGLMDMEEYIEARDYIERVFNDIQRVSSVLKTGNPAVNALVQAKLLFCEKRGITLELFITSRLATLKIPSWEFCRIIGNLIGGSIYALKDVEIGKHIELHLYEDIKNYCFKVCNNGPRISDNVVERIFEPGFTTKGAEGEGMGLAITKEILEEYGGGIMVQSDDVSTCFYGWIAK